MAVREADAWGIMAAYNKVNGRWCSENEALLTTILRQQWGFPGMVISDWGGVHSTVDAVTAGMNVEMPGSRFMGQALLDSVKAGKVSEAVINQRVREILRIRLTVTPIAKDIANSKPVGNVEEMTTALEVARRSIVLLKNEQLLPIDTKHIRHIAVIGENAMMKMALGGVGAGVKTRCEITPLEGLQAILGNQTKITYEPGYKSFDRESRNQHLSPIQPADRQLMAQAVKAAQAADLVIFFAGDNREVETEGSDRKAITLPSGQDELAAALAKVNKRLVTVIVSGGPVDISTVNEVSGALVASWFNGSMGGQALAEVLTGKISPSGKLPMTWPKKLEDVPAYATGTYPQNIENNTQGDIFVDLTRNRSNERLQQLIADYAEQDLVGYRWYDEKQVVPAYPFGHGLSYATFEYSDLNVKPTAEGFDVSFKLTNTSNCDAEEVAQVYVSRPASHIKRPVKELKGFRRIALKAGECQTVNIAIRRTDLCWQHQLPHRRFFRQIAINKGRTHVTLNKKMFGTKRHIASWLLLAVFVPMLLLSSVHIHETGEIIEAECADCVHHSCHGHMTAAATWAHDCVLCQFLTLTMLTAAMMVVTLYILVCKCNLAQPLHNIRAVCCGTIDTRGPPTI